MNFLFQRESTLPLHGSQNTHLKDNQKPTNRDGIQQGNVPIGFNGFSQWKRDPAQGQREISLRKEHKTPLFLQRFFPAMQPDNWERNGSFRPTQAFPKAVYKSRCS